MAKPLFTIIFLIISLVVADRVKTFVNNNKPAPAIEQTDADLLYDATSTNAYDDYINGKPIIDEEFLLE